MSITRYSLCLLVEPYLYISGALCFVLATLSAGWLFRQYYGFSQACRYCFSGVPSLCCCIFPSLGGLFRTYVDAQLLGTRFRPYEGVEVNIAVSLSSLGTNLLSPLTY